MVLIPTTLLVQISFSIWIPNSFTILLMIILKNSLVWNFILEAVDLGLYSVGDLLMIMIMCFHLEFATYRRLSTGRGISVWSTFSAVKLAPTIYLTRQLCSFVLVMYAVWFVLVPVSLPCVSRIIYLISTRNNEDRKMRESHISGTCVCSCGLTWILNISVDISIIYRRKR